MPDTAGGVPCDASFHHRALARVEGGLMVLNKSSAIMQQRAEGPLLEIGASD